MPVNALGVAARTIPVLNANLYTEVGTVSDDKSGLVIQFRRGGDWKTDKSTLLQNCPPIVPLSERSGGIWKYHRAHTRRGAERREKPR